MTRVFSHGAALAATLALVACDNASSGTGPAPSAAPSASPPPAPSAPATSAPATKDAESEAGQEERAFRAWAQGLPQVFTAKCVGLIPDKAKVNALLTVAADGTMSVAVDPPFASGPVAKCVSEQVRGKKVQPFEGRTAVVPFHIVAD